MVDANNASLSEDCQVLLPAAHVVEGCAVTYEFTAYYTMNAREKTRTVLRFWGREGNHLWRRSTGAFEAEGLRPAASRPSGQNLPLFFTRSW